MIERHPVELDNIVWSASPGLDESESFEPPAGQLTPQTFEQLYDAYFPRVYNYLSYRVSSREEAEDLSALVWERVISRYKQFDSRRGTFQNWLWGIARHALTNQTRRNRRHLELDENWEDDEQAGPSEQALRQEELARLSRYLGQLGERDRDLIALRYGANLSQRRIGHLLKMSEPNVAVALGRALRRLRRLFEAEEV